jgi:hypothetical protein
LGHGLPLTVRLVVVIGDAGVAPTARPDALQRQVGRLEAEHADNVLEGFEDGRLLTLNVRDGAAQVF